MQSFSVVFLIAIWAAAVPNASDAATDKVFCYYGSWATYRQGVAKVNVEDIDVSLCSHITYTFVGLGDDGTVRILDDWNDIQLGALRRFSELKKRKSTLKLLVSMGGWNEGSTKYSDVLGDLVRRKRLVQSVVAFVKQWGLDGFDFDWEYPAKRGGKATDYANYISFLRELRAQFGSSLLITVAVGADPAMISTSYNVPAMNQYLDYINLMTYDYNGYYNGQTGQNSPLYPIDTDINRDFNINATVTHWLKNGASPQKLFIGIGFYAQSFTLSNAARNTVGAAAKGAGKAGTYSQQPGLLMYSEICTEWKKGGWNYRYDERQECAYAFNGDQWLGFDNARSIKAKANYAVQKNLAGVMVWAVDYDDIRNECGTGNNVLLKAIVSVIKI